MDVREGHVDEYIEKNRFVVSVLREKYFIREKFLREKIFLSKLRKCDTLALFDGIVLLRRQALCWCSHISHGHS